MLKVFQVTISGGEWEDSYNYIDSTYLDRTKAEARVKELQDKYLEQVKQAQLCNGCTLCDKDKDCYIPEVDEFDDEWCKNFVDYPINYWNNETYTIVEREVIE